MKAWSGYEGSNWSPSRGFVYFPTLDTRRDLSDYTLYELRRRSRWLYVNVGLGTRIIDGIAGMVGALTPVPLTDDKDWNQLALKSFLNSAGAEFVFDVSGKFNFWSAQPMLTGCRLIDGDVLAILTETQSQMARVMFYEAHQLGNSDTNLPSDDQWVSGVQVTPQNRALAYRILTADSGYGATPYSPGIGTKVVDIPAADVILHCLYRRPCRQRGEPALRHAINHLLDRAEVLGYMKLGAKNAAQIGYYITRVGDFTAGPSLPAKGMGINPADSTTPAGAKIKVEEAFRGGKVPEMDPGEEIKTLLDQRPHPNQVEFLDYLVRDISWGTGFSPDVLWNIAKLGGASVRYVMADAQKTIDQMQALLADQFCSRFWIYYLAKELKTKRLRPCQDPEWWKHGWQPEQKMTVDIGRDGRLFLDMHKAGMISLKRWFGSSLGANWQPEMDDYLDERKYIIEGVRARGMTMEEAFPPVAGTSNISERATVPGGLPEEQIPLLGPEQSANQ